ncbi:MAG: ABC-2 transporter permease [Bacilli bacterium]|nr:ABC-2 transporter permease [Bacilli bacterium]
MYGLIKKDLLMIKQNLKNFILVFIIFLSMTIINKSDMTFILPFMAVMISISTFSYDNYNKWDAYAVTLPNGRKNIVRAKYISTLIFVIISFIISIISLFIINKCGMNIDLNSSLNDLSGCLVLVFLIMSIMFPIMYKFDVEKGRIALFILTFGITGISVLIMNNVNIAIPDNIIDFFKNYYKILIPIITCLLIFISYKISERFYSKKEF